jgi:hypothetical protein
MTLQSGISAPRRGRSIVKHPPTPDPLVLGSAPLPTKFPIIDPDDLPDEYGMICVGDCMEPLIKDGAVLHFSKSLPYVEGDFVGLWLKPEAVSPGHPQCRVKRLVRTWPGLKLPYKAGPMSNVMPLLMTEMFKPRKQFNVPVDMLLAVHLCLGEVPAGMATVDMTGRAS